MSINAVDEFKCLSPGCEVWITTTPAVSKWARRLDWYLNSQISRFSRHPVSESSPTLKKIIADEGFEFAPIKIDEQAPLMIASQRLLPNSKTVVLPFRGDLQIWAAGARKIWNQLNNPSLRIFLPDGVKFAAFEKIWSEEDVRQSSDASSATPLLVEIVGER